MTSLVFPDVNVWMALLLANHVHRASAAKWWESGVSETIAFCRITQLSVLRLLTTAMAMNGKPLSMKNVWKAYEELFADDRVVFVAEPDAFEPEFKRRSRAEAASPKVWADAYLIALAVCTNAALVTFDQAFEQNGIRCLVLR